MTAHDHTPRTGARIHVARSIVAGEPSLSAIENVEYLPKGFSQDTKYVLSECGRPRYLLRMSHLKLRDRRRKEFDLLRKHHDRGIQCSEPLLFGVDETNGVCYLVVGFIEGECADEALPKLSENLQFDIGLASGRELRRLHELPCPDRSFDWASHRWAKCMRNVNEIAEIRIDFPRRLEIERYVDRNRHLLDGRPVRFQHDDFHPGNMILRDGRLAGIIDFNRWDWGDPIHDFYKLPWFGFPVSVPFARGQVTGYFPEGVPSPFWPLYNLYVAMSFHASVCWAYRNERNEMEWWLDRIRDIIDTHDLATGCPPSWFQPP